MPVAPPPPFPTISYTHALGLFAEQTEGIIYVYNTYSNVVAREYL